MGQVRRSRSFDGGICSVTSGHVMDHCDRHAGTHVEVSARHRMVACDRQTSRVMRADSRDINRFVRWGFYAFVFSIPLEYPDRTIPVELHTITGALFLVIALLQPSVCFRRPPAAF